MKLTKGTKVYYPIHDCIIRVITVNDSFATRENILLQRGLGSKIFLSKVLAEKYAVKLKQRTLQELQEQVLELQKQIHSLVHTEVTFQEG